MPVLLPEGRPHGDEPERLLAEALIRGQHADPRGYGHQRRGSERHNEGAGNCQNTDAVQNVCSEQRRTPEDVDLNRVFFLMNQNSPKRSMW